VASRPINVNPGGEQDPPSAEDCRHYSDEELRRARLPWEAEPASGVARSPGKEARDCMWFKDSENHRHWSLNHLPCSASWDMFGAEDLAPVRCSPECLLYESVKDIAPGDNRAAEQVWFGRVRAARRQAW
jgi:hypothetical protein